MRPVDSGHLDTYMKILTRSFAVLGLLAGSAAIGQQEDNYEYFDANRETLLSLDGKGEENRG